MHDVVSKYIEHVVFFMVFPMCFPCFSLSESTWECRGFGNSRSSRPGRKRMVILSCISCWKICTWSFFWNHDISVTELPALGHLYFFRHATPSKKKHEFRSPPNGDIENMEGMGWHRSLSPALISPAMGQQSSTEGRDRAQRFQLY